ncbi:MAG TPA: hypothetical protein DEH25_08235 [Chloroflexi bacterium]|nr:hypothetical protein [Chloroflexota bacterium]HBY07055.1 hypothetical protein [Chloroflexota bacterium]
MDRTPQGTRSPEAEPTSERLSAFEMSINLEFQAHAPSQGSTNPKVGALCPICQSAKMDYDGMLNLSCLQCGYSLAGCFT